MELNELFDLVKTLREKCPWDKSQTLPSLKNKVIEESYELVDAISEDKTPAIIEEIGDVLFLALFLARILEQDGRASLDAIIDSTIAKYRAKHPHVFGDTDLKDEHEVLKFWHKSKEDIFTGVPEILPALLAAKVIQERASRVGFDWTTASGPLEKVREEIDEVEHSPDEDRAGELGDLLFACVNFARHCGVDPEDALRNANRKFVERFRKVVEELRKQGKDLSDSSLAEMDAIWDGIKKKE